MASLRDTYGDLVHRLRFDDRGLVPAILQEWSTGRVLMLAYMNRQSLEKTLETGHCWFYSRSRDELWEKGATSGNYQRVREIRLDCDGDALLVLVDPDGPACHRGTLSCFDALSPEEKQGRINSFFEVLACLREIIHQRYIERPGDSYTVRLFAGGPQAIAKKVGEEGVEVALAALAESDDRLASEVADLIYHLLVLLEARALDLDAVATVLSSRAKTSKKEKRD